MAGWRWLTQRGVTTILLSASTLGSSFAADGAPPLIDPTVASKVTAASTRVIVELRLPGRFRPEGELGDAAAVARQRQEIVGARQIVLGRLRGTRFTLLHEYASVPMLALEIGPDAFAALQQMGDIVVRVVDDALAAPNAPAGTRGSRPP